MDPSRHPSWPYQFQVHGERTMCMVVDSGESTEGERCRECEQEQECERYACPHSPTPTYQYRDTIPISLEEENARLREENERLTNRLRIMEFEKEQLLQKTLFLQEQMESKLSSSSTLPVRRDDNRSSLSYHPYARVERYGASREASPGPDCYRQLT